MTSASRSRLSASIFFGEYQNEMREYKNCTVGVCPTSCRPHVRTNCNHLKPGGDLENESKQATFMSSASSRSRLPADTFSCSIYSTCRPVTTTNPGLGGLRGGAGSADRGKGKKFARYISTVCLLKT